MCRVEVFLVAAFEWSMGGDERAVLEDADLVGEYVNIEDPATCSSLQPSFPTPMVVSFMELILSFASSARQTRYRTPPRMLSPSCSKMLPINECTGSP